MNLRNELLSAAFGALASFAEDVSEIFGETAGSDANAETSPAAHACGHHHAPRTEDAEPQDAPSVEGLAWENKFAHEVTDGDVIRLDGRHIDQPAGDRALRVVRKKTVEHQGMFGGPSEGLILLLRDLDSEKPHSIEVNPNVPLLVALPTVPDSVPSDAAGLDGDA